MNTKTNWQPAHKPAFGMSAAAAFPTYACARPFGAAAGRLVVMDAATTPVIDRAKGAIPGSSAWSPPIS